jgi:hypothetical protein
MRRHPATFEDGAQWSSLFCPFRATPLVLSIPRAALCGYRRVALPLGWFVTAPLGRKAILTLDPRLSALLWLSTLHLLEQTQSLDRWI